MISTDNLLPPDEWGHDRTRRRPRLLWRGGAGREGSRSSSKRTAAEPIRDVRILWTPDPYGWPDTPSRSRCWSRNWAAREMGAHNRRNGSSGLGNRMAVEGSSEAPVRATVMYGAGDVRIETVPDALIVVTRAAVCDSGLWPQKTLAHGETGRRMGLEAIGLVEAVGGGVHTVKTGDVVVMPSAYSDGTCVFCRKGLHTSCLHGGSSARGEVGGAQAEAVRAPRQTEHSSSCRPAQTTRCYRRCSLCQT